MENNGNYIADGFPHPTLTPLTGEPNHASLKTLQVQLSTNAASVNSLLGNGVLGLICLTMSEANYDDRSNIPFVLPINPGPFIANQGTQHKLAVARDIHQEQVRILREYQATDKLLRK